MKSLYLYSSKDERFEDDTRIIKRESIYLTSKYKFLEEWTGLQCGEVIFDSSKDNWNVNTSVLNERIINKKQLTFIIEDEDNEIFGYYLNTEVVEKYRKRQETDSKSFEFNLQSKNNRLKRPMKFEIKNLYWGGIYLFEKSDVDLIWLGDFYLRKENRKNLSYCEQYEDSFDYHGIKNALCGKVPPEDFTQKRILVIQMK